MWVRNTDSYDPVNGGMMYADAGEASCRAAGWTYMDGGDGDRRFFAFAAEFRYGEDRYGDVTPSGPDDAGDAFADAIDSDVSEEIGWFATARDAERAVEEYVGA